MDYDGAMLALQGLWYLFVAAIVFFVIYLVFAKYADYREKKRNREGVERMLKYVEEWGNRDQ